VKIPIGVTLSAAKGLVLPQGEILHFVQNDVFGRKINAIPV